MKHNFYTQLAKELKRIDTANTAKRYERVISGFTPDHKAIINDEEYYIFNSNDYLGLRFHKKVVETEHTIAQQYGAGPGSVRFITGTYKVYKDLEKELAAFHGRDDAIVFSSAFAANLSVISCLIKGQSKDSLVSGNTLVISDALNHRSIIEGIRVANLRTEQRLMYAHLDADDLDKLLHGNKGKFTRVIVITDGIFSMLGEAANLKEIKTVIDTHDTDYEEGVLLVVDDSHGVGAYGQSGRGCEEVSEVKSDVLVGTLGKAFGADGGYAVGDQVVIDYLRESAATYIYSNSISPSVAGAALESVKIVDSGEGAQLLEKLQSNISVFKELTQKAQLELASDSSHPIQPILIGDTAQAKRMTQELFTKHILVTPISYPVVPSGRDEIRVQLSALHSHEDIASFIDNVVEGFKTIQ
jgi:glycine C-acetyltransferase